MTTAAQERAWWDAQADDEQAARRAVWAETGHDWDARAADCVEAAVVPLDPQPGDVLVDLGCGVGRLLIPAAQRWMTVTFIGIDISPRMVHLAKERAGAVGVESALLVGDGRRLAIEGDIEGAWSMLLFQHLPPGVVQGYVQDVGNRLVPGGRFRFQFVEGTWHAEHHHQVKEDEARGWCDRAGLDVETVERGLIYPEWTWFTAVKP